MRRVSWEDVDLCVAVNETPDGKEEESYGRFKDPQILTVKRTFNLAGEAAKESDDASEIHAKTTNTISENRPQRVSFNNSKFSSVRGQED